MTLYDVLGVEPDSTAAEIKAAYRRLAKGNHPDLVGGEGVERMKEVNAAYEVLGDPARRKRYDETGSDKNFDARKVAEERLAMLFDDYLGSESEVEGDLVKVLARRVQRVQHGIKADAVLVRRAVARLEKRARRLKGPPLFKTLATRKIQANKQRLLALEEESESADLVLEMLKAYRDVAPPEAATTSTADIELIKRVFSVT